MLSYWEKKEWFSDIDFTIIGSGIVGLNAALRLRERFPLKKVLVVERGILPNGASTKNAGFACFGSLSEILDDLNTHTEEEVYNLVEKRWKGLSLLRKTLGDNAIGFEQNGGYEVFTKEEKDLLQKCIDHKNAINNLLKPIFRKDVFKQIENSFGFRSTEGIIYNHFEGQIDTGKMMHQLLQKAFKENIQIINGIEITDFSDFENEVKIETNHNFAFKTKYLLITTNGFAKQLLEENVQPARAQVLITKPIKGLKIKGTFHLDKGYYYFRNINNRILLGGGRNLAFQEETTVEMNTTELIQDKLEALLKQVILPGTPLEIDQRWSGIMGVGKQKKAIVKPISDRVYCGVRLGGMGVAIGSLVGQEVADLVY